MANKLHLVCLVCFCLLASLYQANAQQLETQRHASPSTSLIHLDQSQFFTLNQADQLVKQQFNLREGAHDFEIIHRQIDQIGMEHLRMQQYFRNLKVEFATYTLHARSNRVESMSGELYEVKGVDTRPQLSAKAAFRRALDHVGATDYLWDDPVSASVMDYQQPTGELLLLPVYHSSSDNSQYSVRLAYKFDIYATQPLSRADIYIDALTGNVLLENAKIHHVAPADGTAATRYSGSRAIKTDSYNGDFRLRDYTRGNGIETWDLNTGTNYNNAVDFVDNDNNWTAGEWDNAQKDNAALDAHWGAMMTYDYWQSEHNRNSFDGAGAKIRSYVHYSSNYDNAFWNGSVMTYGDGSGTYFDALTSLDVAAHEIGHAVCTNTANLAYQRESGALNEAFSDIWAAAVEAYAAPEKAIWLIGEDIERRSGSQALRSMSDPNSEGQPDTYGGAYWTEPNCGTPSSSNDYCGVHRNSGVLNYWFYLITEGGSGTNDNGDSFSVSAIGISKAAQIAFRLESVYLSANSTFQDAMVYGIQSARDLYGAGSPEEVATTEAFYAVGIGDGYGFSCGSTVSSFPYSEGFESGLGAWQQSNGDGLDWARNSGGTPSSNTGPSSASAGSWYLYVEASDPNYPTKTTIVKSPCFDLSGATAATFSFDYHMYGSGPGTLSLQATSGGSWSTVWSISGNQGNAWLTQSADLSAYAGSSVQLRFVGTTANTWSGDIAVDDISMSTSGGGGGGDTQAPTTPTNLQATNITETTATLTWNASTDNVGVVQYNVYQGASLLGSVGGTSANITGLIANTQYTFYVSAQDAAGNESAQASVTFTTNSSGGGSGCSGNSVLVDSDFESGWQGWIDGGGDCFRYSGTYSYQGNYSIRIRDNTGTRSAMTYQNIDLTSYDAVEISFTFFPNSMENGEDFWVRYYNGSGWSTVAAYASGTSFSNGSFYTATVTLNSSDVNFATNSGFRIQCDASGNNDQIYVDLVTITGICGAPLTTFAGPQEPVALSTPNFTTFETEGMDLFPNPASDQLTVQFNLGMEELDEHTNVNLFLRDLTGRIVLQQRWDRVEDSLVRRQLDVSKLPSGMYFLTAQAESGFFATRKVLIE